jgi:hypothetical protein
MPKLFASLFFVIICLLVGCSRITLIFELDVHFVSSTQQEAATYIQFWSYESKYPTPQSDSIIQQLKWNGRISHAEYMEKFYMKAGLDTITRDLTKIHFKNRINRPDSVLIERANCGRFIGHFTYPRGLTNPASRMFPGALFFGDQKIEVNDTEREVGDGDRYETAAFENIKLKCYDPNYRISQHETARDSSSVKVFSVPSVPAK